MTDNDRADFVRLISDVCAFYREPVTDFALAVWLQACRPFPPAAIRKALTAHATDPEAGKWCPKPADIIRQLRGTTRDDALTAWQRVMDQVSSVGRYGTPRLSPSESGALRAIGGWQRLCDADSSENGFLMRDFCANYTAAAAEVERRDMLEPSPEAARIAGEVIGRIGGAGRG